MADSKITGLPTAATSYYTIRKSGQWWVVELVTPSPVRSLRTKLRSFSDRAAAEADARETAARVKRPFRIGGRQA